MENPYGKDAILQLIERRCESSKVDYKKEYPLNEGTRHKIIKDILAMSNTTEPDDTLTAMGINPGYGFIIIGANENGEVFDISEDKLDDSKFQTLMRDYVDPHIHFLFVQFDHEKDGKPIKIGAVIIEPGNKPPYRVVKELQIGQKVALSRGYCPLRIGSATSDNPTDAELEEMFRYRARFSDMERWLQRDEFHVSIQEQSRLEALYVRPGSDEMWKAAVRLLEEKQFLLIYGETGSGKRSTALRMGLDLLKERRVLRILRASRYTDLSTLREVDGAAILLPDGFGLFGLERRELERDISLMDQICERNYLILTSSTEVLGDAMKEPRMQEWDRMRAAQIALNPENYTVFQRKEIMERHLTWAAGQYEITVEQKNLVETWLMREGNLEAFNHSLRRPLDIRRLVNEKLPHASKLADVQEIIKKTGSLDKEISAWFHQLDNDHQCFLFALALFQGVSQLGDGYSKIVNHLRKSFNPNLARLPVGSAGRTAAPYVELREDNTPGFVHPSYHEAILRIIATDYRDYFLSLIDVFEELTRPADDSDEAIRVSEPVREALAFAASQIAQRGVKDLEGLLRAWGSYRKGRLRVPAADVLGQAAQNISQRGAVLDILRQWTERPEERADQHVRDQSKWLRWTAVVAYGRLANVAQDQAIAGLRALATDDRSVRSRVPRELQAFIASRPAETRAIYTQLAADNEKNCFTRREVSRALRFLSSRNPQFVEDLIAEWSGKEGKYRTWTLARTCLINSKLQWEQRLMHLFGCLNKDPQMSALALQDALENGDLNPVQAWTLIRGMVQVHPPASSVVPILVGVLDRADPRVSWDCIERLADHTDANLRRAAAYILAAWTEPVPENVSSLLEKLRVDSDPEVVAAASTPPVFEFFVLDLDDENDETQPSGNLDVEEGLIIIEFDDDDLGITILGDAPLPDDEI